jgi:6-phosphogluconate dehydrogenase
MVEHGKPVDEMIRQLVGRESHLRGVIDSTPLVKLMRGDIIIDGGNSFFKDSIRRYQELKKRGIHFLDVGTSGGLEGARHGACLMVGGEEEIFLKLKPLLEKIAVKDGVAYFGPAGAGHFVKMVHNGVEYGMLQAIGEGFEILSKGMPNAAPFARGPLAKKVNVYLYKVAFNWSHGSVVRGWLMELLACALKSNPRLETIEGVIGGGTTGEWTVKTAKELKVEIPVIKKSVETRKKSLAKPTFSGKVVAALRREFGGHAVKTK